ncbi:MAG TPA: prenyltransferase/squalene oxidase repeat-containing protein [Solirubrobacterales bacterium]|nr:prenyltransferase/squalene oxidase repeat-containing protein [Solirubrobacterales bacterium]
MTWQLTAYALLALVLAGGLAWYERSRPPARIVALVAALAALAVAGRLALAPIPNVVATTDIVLITGYAVGAAPGFAVGALAAVVSNLWLGQGPWTPWQMAGWGLVGIGGAALAVLTGRRLGRGGLAVACGLAGLAYGALLDLSVMVSYGGEQSLDRYLALSARGIPFNVAHAAGNIALALAAGPALVRMVSRYRSRFEFTWPDGPARQRAEPRATAGGVALLLAAIAVVGALALPGEARAGTASARHWLERMQNADGGFGASPEATSNAAITGWAVLGMEAAGRNPLDVKRGGRSAVGYLRSQVAELRSTGDLERTILALEGAGADPRSFGGRDLVAELRRRRSGNGSFEGQVNLTAFGVLALRAAGVSPSAVRSSAAWLRQAQNNDGGWGFQPDAGSDPDSTGAVVQGLAAAGGAHRATARGTSYLRRAQRSDGGFALADGGPTNSQSTAWAVQGLIAGGTNPAVRTNGRSPFDYLESRQAADGHYRYSQASDQTPVWVTAQALLAVSRKAFPLAAVPRSPAGARSGSGPGDTAGTGSAESTQGDVSPTGGPVATGRPSGGAPGDPAQPRQGVRGELAAGGRPDAAAPPVAAATADGGRPGTSAYVGAGFALLTAALVGGFFWYRRRLPE